MRSYYELSKQVKLKGIPLDMINVFNALSLSMKNIADLSDYVDNYPSYYALREYKKGLENFEYVVDAILQLSLNHGVYPQKK